MKNKEMLWKNNNIKIHDKVNVIGQVYITDYSKLENAEGQRSLSAKGLKQLSDSLLEYGSCSCPIVVKQNKKYLVVDGWHRISVSKKNNLDIICTLVNPSCTINELMIILNTTQVNWNPEAFLNNGIVYHKNKDYIYLREIWEDSGINIAALYEIYSDDLTKAKAKHNFEKGEWKITTKTLGNKVINYVEEINKYVNFSYKTNFIRGFVTAVSKKGFKIEHLIKQLKKYPNHIHDSGDKISGHLNMINKIYNHCCLEEDQCVLTK
tara:strand:- start:3228 stop:4022 length:795 start_codon:yes stop_codon:yes gene_type:complete